MKKISEMTPDKLAGFREVGETKGGLLALQLLPEDMPEPEAAKEARNGTP